MSLPSYAYPGLALGPSSKYAAGAGTHVHESHIVASLCGVPTLVSSSSSKSAPQSASSSAARSTSLPTLSVIRRSGNTSAPVSRCVVARGPLPALHSVVLGTVTRVQRERVAVAICAVDGVVVAGGGGGGVSGGASGGTDAPAGVIRREDVRGWDVDKVVTGDLFRVGDVVRAAVISLGDANAYYLSTARNELGVLMARPAAEGANGVPERDAGASASGGGGGGDAESGQGWMVPVSWREFRDPRTGRTEERKVAKPV